MKYLTFVLLSFNLANCSSEPEASNLNAKESSHEEASHSNFNSHDALEQESQEEENLQDSNEAATEPSNITGIFITCLELFTLENSRSKTLGCSLANDQGPLKGLPSDQVQWTIRTDQMIPSAQTKSIVLKNGDTSWLLFTLDPGDSEAKDKIEESLIIEAEVSVSSEVGQNQVYMATLKTATQIPSKHHQEALLDSLHHQLSQMNQDRMAMLAEHLALREDMIEQLQERLQAYYDNLESQIEARNAAQAQRSTDLAEANEKRNQDLAEAQEQRSNDLAETNEKRNKDLAEAQAQRAQLLNEVQELRAKALNQPRPPLQNP